jgi:hypothetical protein
MSGHITHAKKVTRRNFVKKVALTGAGLGAIGFSCFRFKNWMKSHSEIKMRNHNLDGKAHLIRKNQNIQLTSASKTSVAIIGAGISGLTAGYFLKKSGFDDFKIFEMNSEAGGNSEYFSSKNGQASWGAHYLPIIRNEDALLKDFLTEHQIIVGQKDGLPIYNEEFLCQDPHERLLIRGHWQESLIPDYGLDLVTKNELKEFHQLTNELKNKKGRDGKFIFSIPIDQSSQDPEYLKLDQISFKEFLIQKNWTSEAINWYANYACQDDFGTRAEDVSAWAGLFYFSARNGLAANTEEQSVITWPHGNGYLSELLQKNIKDHIQLNSSVQKINSVNSRFEIDIQNLKSQTGEKVSAKNIIYCLPRFTAPYVLNNYPKHDFLHYSPWLVAHIAIRREALTKNHHLAWDTVKYLESDLGYINNHHQSLSQDQESILITFYFAFTKGSPTENRKRLSTWNDDEVKNFILSSLDKYHPNIETEIQSIDYRILGHGMISPSIGFLWNKRIKDLPKLWNGIHFAHSDMSGISIFEEAFHRGHEAYLQIKKVI